MMVSMAGLQVFVVRFFFQGARKGAYSSSSPSLYRTGLATLLRLDVMLPWLF